MNIRPLFFSLAALSVSPVFGEILQATADSWNYLLYRVDSVPRDPATIDPDFNTTWQNPVGYSGPPFLTGSGYFGYGSIDSETITVNVWNPDGSESEDEPPEGARLTVYFRTTITPTEAVSNLKFTGVIDDGVVVYLDGQELTRFQVGDFPDTWALRANNNGDEDNPSRFFAAVDLAPNVPVTVAVSLHNSSSSSSDIGFGLEIESVEELLPPNDLFTDASEITGDLPISISGISDNNLGMPGAFKEAGEPDHADQPGGASLWWKYTAISDGRLAISADSTAFTPLLAIYTGESVDALTPVRRYETYTEEASSIADSELFFENARVEFTVTAGTTYYIAVDGEDGQVGQVNLTLEEGYSPLEPTALLLPAGSDWEHLIAVDSQTEPVDPADLDPAFYDTWRNPIGYNGPTFLGPSPAPLGYGGVNASPIVTEIWEAVDPNGEDLPDRGDRNVAYFRTLFTPENAVRHLGFEGLFDDGAIIYINDEEAARINVDPTEDADDWTLTAVTPVVDDRPTETHAQYAVALDQNLPAGVPVRVAVSLHNNGDTSSDLGMDMRIFAMGEVPEPASFSAALTPGETAGTFTLTWDSVPGATYLIQSSPDLKLPWSPANGPTITGGPDGTNSAMITPDGDILFYRVLRVSQ